MRASVLSRWALKYWGLAVVKNRVTKDIMEHTLAVEGMQTRARYVGLINCSLSFAFVMNARSLTRLVCVEMRSCARLKRHVGMLMHVCIHWLACTPAFSNHGHWHSRVLEREDRAYLPHQLQPVMLTSVSHDTQVTPRTNARKVSFFWTTSLFLFPFMIPCERS
jgi:hypothetical protein